MIQLKGVVFKSTGSRYLVQTSSKEIFECRIKGKLRTKGIRTTNPVTVGDVVFFEDQEEIAESGRPLGVIIKLGQRKNYIIRKSVNLSKESHIIAANIDQAFVVATIKHPVTYLTFIDRFLATAEAYNIPAKIIINKRDLYLEEDLLEAKYWQAIYKQVGYECILTSCETNEGLDRIKELMQNKISLFSGHSGVGKSTLINKIDSNLHLKTNIISDYHKSGKHTTTFSEMFELQMGGFIVDTPGIRAFGMIDMKYDDVSHYFPEIFKTSDQCKFNNCSHTHEPNCAVVAAVEKGEIPISRYESYLSILNEDENEKYRAAF